LSAAEKRGTAEEDGERGGGVENLESEEKETRALSMFF
jgi:hypothetical protein